MLYNQKFNSSLNLDLFAESVYLVLNFVFSVFVLVVKIYSLCGVYEIKGKCFIVW